MELYNLIEGYELLDSTSQFDPQYSETGRTVLLHDDGFVRVYLMKGPDIWEEISLEIEVFMGASNISESAHSESTNDNSDDISLSRFQLIRCISYMEYMLRLEEAGFNLEVVLDGCIWTGRYIVGKKPDSQLLRTIIPPNHYDSGEGK